MEKISQYCTNIKNKKSFQYFVTTVILISSLTIGVKTYSINDNIYGLLLITDYAITIIFLIEIIIRFLAEKRTKDFFSDGWNIFDLVIVIGSLIPASVTESVLVLRLLRLLRLLRIISFIPELQTIVENLAVSLRKSVYILLLIFIITYKASFRLLDIAKKIPLKYLKNKNYKILISDDSSNDDTIEYISKFKNKFKSKVVINLNKKNHGYGANIKRCIKYAFKTTYIVGTKYR